MAKGTKKVRCPNWSHEETLVLTELKKDTFFRKQEGRLVWEQIAHSMSSRFPDQKRSHDQCRRRWETLTKTYNHIETYCMVTGQDHWQLDEEELRSMRLDTAYRQDWYSIVKQVCSQRKRKEKPEDDFDPAAVKARSKKLLDNVCSSSKRPEPTPGRNSLHVTPPTSVHCEPVSASTANGQISTRPSSEADKLSLEEENRRLWTTLREKDHALNLALEQLQQRGQVAQQNQVPYNSPAEVRVNVKEPLQDIVTDYHEAMAEHSSKAAHDQDGKSCELMVAHSRSLSLEVFVNDLLNSSTNFSFPAATDLWWDPASWVNGTRIYFVRTTSAAGRSLNVPNKDPDVRQGEEMLELSTGSSNICIFYRNGWRTHGDAETEPHTYHC